MPAEQALIQSEPRLHNSSTGDAPCPGRWLPG